MLINHLKVCHNMEISEEEHKFVTLKKFLEWKQEEEVMLCST